jgi:hypothetical protein
MTVFYVFSLSFLGLFFVIFDWKAAGARRHGATCAKRADLAASCFANLAG